jgi:hypothetical protein
MKKPKILDTSDELDSYDTEFSEDRADPVHFDFSNPQGVRDGIYESIEREINLDELIEELDKEFDDEMVFDEE